MTNKINKEMITAQDSKQTQSTKQQEKQQKKKKCTRSKVAIYRMLEEANALQERLTRCIIASFKEVDPRNMDSRLLTVYYDEDVFAEVRLSEERGLYLLFGSDTKGRLEMRLKESVKDKMNVIAEKLYQLDKKACSIGKKPFYCKLGE